MLALELRAQDGRNRGPSLSAILASRRMHVSMSAPTPARREHVSRGPRIDTDVWLPLGTYD